MTPSSQNRLTTQDILSTWANPERARSNARMWDNRASHFDEMPLPDPETDPFLKLMVSSIDFSEVSTVLDIGCGAGQYSIALSPLVDSARGIDISPEMIRCARNKASVHHAYNCRFEVADFNSLENLPDYDLVFAHMSPAVVGKDSFLKVYSHAKKYVALAKSTRRTDSVTDDLIKRIGKEPESPFVDDDTLRTFAYAWIDGKNPTFVTVSQQWSTSRAIDEAKTFYVNELSHFELSDQEQADIASHLECIAVDGLVHETISREVAMMCWHM